MSTLSTSSLILYFTSSAAVMTSSNDVPESAPPSASPSPSPGEDLAQALAELEQNVAALRDRHTAVEQAQSEKQELRVRINRAQSELRQHRTKQLQEELETLQNRLDEVELTLESQLFSWSSLKEPFWQAVRFGGIGVVLGWVLKSVVSG